MIQVLSTFMEFLQIYPCEGLQTFESVRRMSEFANQRLLESLEVLSSLLVKS